MLITEDIGDTLKSQLVKSNPWEGEPCERPKCTVCKQDGGGNCNMFLYMNICLICKSEGINCYYLGQTSKYGYERGEKHHSQSRQKSGIGKSHMFLHTAEKHPGRVPSDIFAMKIVRRQKTSFFRELYEALTT